MAVRLVPYFFLLPAGLIIAVLLLYPVGHVFVLSLHNHNMAKPQLQGFVGLDNYARILFADGLFRSSLFLACPPTEVNPPTT